MNFCNFKPDFKALLQEVNMQPDESTRIKMFKDFSLTPSSITMYIFKATQNYTSIFSSLNSMSIPFIIENIFYDSILQRYKFSLERWRLQLKQIGNDHKELHLSIQIANEIKSREGIINKSTSCNLHSCFTVLSDKQLQVRKDLNACEVHVFRFLIATHSIICVP